MVLDKKAYMKNWRIEHKEHIRRYEKIRNPQYYQKNKEKLKERQKNYYHNIVKNNPERYKIFMEKCKMWKKNNPDKLKESCKKYRENHKDNIKKHYLDNKKKYIEKANFWHKNNKEKFRKITKKYRKTQKGKLANKKCKIKRYSKIKKIIHAFTYNEWIAKRNATNGICPKCNTFIGTEKLTLDHIFPIKKAEEGRIYTIDDVQPLCKSCNSSKNDKIIIGMVNK